MQSEDIIKARARGLMLGQFVGDALGTTLEFTTAAQCASRYPGGLRDVVGGGPFNMAAGQVTDDGELAVTLARTLVAHGDDLDERAAAYAAWMDSNPPDRGMATAAALGGWRGRATAAAMFTRTMQVNGDPGKQANGALMRVSPLGIHAALLAPDDIGQRAATDARFTHPSPVCQAANVAFVRALAVGVRGGTPKEGHEEAMSSARNGAPEVLAALQDVARAPVAEGRGQGWVMVALRMAFHHLLHAPSLEEGLVATVMAGGDTDTNGAITGALLGAFHGEEAIPARWRDKVLGCRVRSRPAAYHVNDALELADALAEGGRALRSKP